MAGCRRNSDDWSCPYVKAPVGLPLWEVEIVPLSTTVGTAGEGSSREMRELPSRETEEAELEGAKGSVTIVSSSLRRGFFKAEVVRGGLGTRTDFPAVLCYFSSSEDERSTSRVAARL